jgi:hypothetical protein
VKFWCATDLAKEICSSASVVFLSSTLLRWKLLGDVAWGDQQPVGLFSTEFEVSWFTHSNKMSNRAVEQQNFDAKDPFAGLALVTKPVPKAEPGHVVVRITLRPVNPTDLLSISSNRLRIPGSEGFGIIHEVKQASFFLQFHAVLLGSILALF